jgi:hypothetical protein
VCCKMKNIFAGSMIALMFCVPALAAACDLSCEFESNRTDCHTQQMEVQESASTTMNMDGMAMPEMAGADSGNQGAAFGGSQGMPAHAALVDMINCERQSCDQAQASAARENRPPASHFDTIWTDAGSLYVDSLQRNFHHTVDDVGPRGMEIHGPPNISLRI